MCFYFSVHVKAVVKLVAIYWNALLTTPSLKKKRAVSKKMLMAVLSVWGLSDPCSCFLVHRLFSLVLWSG